MHTKCSTSSKPSVFLAASCGVPGKIWRQGREVYERSCRYERAQRGDGHARQPLEAPKCSARAPSECQGLPQEGMCGQCVLALHSACATAQLTSVLVFYTGRYAGPRICSQRDFGRLWKAKEQEG